MCLKITTTTTINPKDYKLRQHFTHNTDKPLILLAKTENKKMKKPQKKKMKKLSEKNPQKQGRKYSKNIIKQLNNKIGCLKISNKQP